MDRSLITRTEEIKVSKTFFLTILKFGMYYTLGIAMAAVILLPSVIGFLGNGRYGNGVDWKSLIVYPGKYYLMFIENFIGYGNMGSNTNAGYLPIVGIVVLFTLFSQRMKHKKYRAAFIASIIALILPIFGYAFNGFSYAKQPVGICIELYCCIVDSRNVSASVCDVKTTADWDRSRNYHLYCILYYT